MRGLLIFRHDDQRQFAPRHDRADLARERGQHQPRGFLADLKHVHVRVGVIAADGGGALHHRPRHVGVQVQRHHDGQVRAQDFACAPQQVALHVILALGGLRAVHSQQQPFRIRNGRQVRTKFIAQAHKIRAHQTIGGDRPRRTNRRGTLPCFRQDREEPAHLRQPSLVPLQHGGAEHRIEILVMSHHRRKRIAFLHDGRYSNAHLE